MNLRLLCTLALALPILAGCSSNAKRETAESTSGSQIAGRNADGSITAGSEAARDEADRRMSRELIANSSLPKVFYFEFDSTEIKAQDQQALQQWGGLLKANPVAKVRLEGHADERGTPEYNLGLGERRANAVRDMLVQGGATAGQFIIMSYGESKPVDTSHSPMAWNLNRRVEIVELK